MAISKEKETPQNLVTFIHFAHKNPWYELHLIFFVVNNW
jgi:hypothetical protein